MDLRNSIALTFGVNREKLGNKYAVDNPLQVKQLKGKQNFISKDKDQDIHQNWKKEAFQSVRDGIKRNQIHKIQLLQSKKRLKPNPGGYQLFGNQKDESNLSLVRELKGGVLTDFNYAQKILKQRADQLRSMEVGEEEIPGADVVEPVEITEISTKDKFINQINNIIGNILSQIKNKLIDANFSILSNNLLRIISRFFVIAEPDDKPYLENLKSTIDEITDKSSDGMTVELSNVPGEEEKEKREAIIQELTGKLEIISDLLGEYLDKNIQNLQFNKKKIAVAGLLRKNGFSKIATLLKRIKNPGDIEQETQTQTEAETEPEAIEDVGFTEEELEETKEEEGKEQETKEEEEEPILSPFERRLLEIGLSTSLSNLGEVLDRYTRQYGNNRKNGSIALANDLGLRYNPSSDNLIRQTALKSLKRIITARLDAI